jgi:hypothetical protein
MMMMMMMMMMMNIIIIRHDIVCAQLHFNIYKEIGVKIDNKDWFDHVPKSVETSHEGKVIILWSQHVRNGRTVPNNRLDIDIRDNKKGTCMLIAVAISGDRNVIKKEAEMILKYKDFVIEIQRTWNVKSSDTSDNRSDWNCFKITQTIPEQRTMKARN